MAKRKRKAKSRGRVRLLPPRPVKSTLRFYRMWITAEPRASRRQLHSLGQKFVQTLIERANAGLDMKIAYDHTKPNANSPQAFTKLGGDPAPKGTHAAMQEHFAGASVQTKAVLTIPASVADKPVKTEPIAGSHLMHSKYIIRDTHTSQASIWTGSTNFTDDAWTHQENNILRIQSPALAQFYETDFQELWATGNIKSTGVNDQGSMTVSETGVEIAFAPGGGPGMDAHIASLISSAKKRINLPGIEFDGIYDGSEMDTTLKAWQNSGSPQAALFTSLAKRLVKKKSKLFTQGGLHNFMHDKIVVCDDAVATGSFNFSKSATLVWPTSTRLTSIRSRRLTSRSHRCGA
jgi:phosphatidylserine/phosphatidylglycerophosphate/cardiolipin synthase-like enzyme